MKKIYTVFGLLLTLLSFGQAPTISWTYTLPAPVQRTVPAIANDGTIYVACSYSDPRTAVVSPATTANNFFAVNPIGTQKWQASITEGALFDKVDQIEASPSINADGSIYIGGHFGRRMYKFNATDGTFSTKDLGSRIRYSAAAFASNGTVYQGTRNNGNKGFRSLTSDLTTENWISQSAIDFNSTPAIASDGTIYAISTNGNIYAINPDGTQKWAAAYSAGGGFASSAIALASDGTVYASAKLNSPASPILPDGVLKAYNPTDGTEKWSVTFVGENAEQGGPAVAADGTVYLGNVGGKMQAFNPVTGAILWTYTAGAGIEVVPAIDNLGRLYFGATNGMFYVLNANGTEAYTPLSLGTRINSSAVINSDGKIYVAVTTSTTAGALIALKTTATGLQTGGWPMFGKNPQHTSNVKPIILTSTSNVSIDGFDMYPNPVHNGVLYVKTTLNREKFVQIFDLNGKRVYSKNILANEGIKTSNLISGLYILRVTEEGKVATANLVIK